MAFTLRLILLEKQTLSHNEEEWWVVPGSVPRDGKPSARESGKTLQSLPSAHTHTHTHTHGAVGMNPVLTSTQMGTREHGHTKLHSAPGAKSFGRHVAPDAHAAQSTEVVTVSLCHPSGYTLQTMHSVAADP